jgi:hypothetical protein
MKLCVLFRFAFPNMFYPNPVRHLTRYERFTIDPLPSPFLHPCAAWSAVGRRLVANTVTLPPLSPFLVAPFPTPPPVSLDIPEL